VLTISERYVDVSVNIFELDETARNGEPDGDRG
jgi:hypothetical protein